jgi:hypothetical protein
VTHPGVLDRTQPRDGERLDEIVRLVGHSSTAVTELVYRQQIRPVLQSGAQVMDCIFGDQPDAVSSCCRHAALKIKKA